jgi:hypothetical protein
MRNRPENKLLQADVALNSEERMLEKIISSGRTGTDRATLYGALELRLM